MSADSQTAPVLDDAKLKTALKRTLEIKKKLEEENEKLAQDLEARSMKIDMLTQILDETSEEKESLAIKLNEEENKVKILDQIVAKLKGKIGNRPGLSSFTRSVLRA